MIRRPPRSTLFPSTPLFRSSHETHTPGAARRALGLARADSPGRRRPRPAAFPEQGLPRRGLRRHRGRHRRRSEEHTSELQSPCNLVCRLLLEKKKFRVLLLRGMVETVINSSDPETRAKLRELVGPLRSAGALPESHAFLCVGPQAGLSAQPSA